jgi:small subunit ribosomal protein S14
MLKISSKIEVLRKKVFKKEKIHNLSNILNPFIAQKNNLHFKKYFSNVQQKVIFNSPLTKTRTICFLTGRTHSVYRAFRVSRLKLRFYANAGYFVGLSKASW